jgi:hypothetical protein
MVNKMKKYKKIVPTTQKGCPFSMVCFKIMKKEKALLRDVVFNLTK